MQKLLSFILVLSFFSYQSYHSLIYMNYIVNKNHFANVLCENKDNPEKQDCNGKCHLKKQLDKQKPVEDKHPFSKTMVINFYPDLLAVLLDSCDRVNQFKISYTIMLPRKHSVLDNHIRDIFHPPEVTSCL